MEAHFLGKNGQNGSKDGQDPKSGDSASSATGTSLAVRQFADAAFGWVPVHSPIAPFRVAEVVSEQRYCMGCFGVRNFDVVKGKSGEVAAFCRCCGKEM